MNATCDCAPGACASPGNEACKLLAHPHDVAPALLEGAEIMRRETGMEDHPDAQTLERAATEIMALRRLVGELTDDETCRYDHHDYCQTHRLDERPCPNERALALLARYEEQDCGG